MRQRSNAATHAASLRTPPRGQEDRREAHHDGSSNIDAEREGTTSTAVVREARASGTVAVAVQTRQRGMPGHPWPSQARSGTVKPRRPRCSRPASSPPSPSHASHLPRLPEATPEPSPPPARPGPDGTQRAQIWAEWTTPDPAAAPPRRQRRRRRPVARLHAPRSPAATPDRRRLDAPPGAAPPVPESDREGKGQEAAATSSPRAKPAAGAGDGGWLQMTWQQDIVQALPLTCSTIWMIGVNIEEKKHHEVKLGSHEAARCTNGAENVLSRSWLKKVIFRLTAVFVVMR
nr:atherin-like [Aegilops tauschii subsp. strangulata]